MSLSDREQQLLDEIERSLLADDPKFASSLDSHGEHTRAWVASGMSLLGILIGFGCIAVGLIAAGSLSVMVTAAGTALLVGTSWSAIRARRRRPAGPPRAQK